MIDALKKLDVSFKDILVLMPIVGSTLAVSWEVGSFLPIGLNLFGFFNLSEHVLFALEALPLILVANAIGLAFAVGISKLSSPELAKGSSKKLWIFVLVNFALASIALAVGIISRSGSAIVVSLLFFLLSAVTVLKAFYRFSTEMRTGLTFAVLAIVLAFVIANGADATRKRMSSSQPAEFATKGGVTKAILLRAGDRGLVLYEPGTQRLLFQKWDSIDGMTWARTPLSTSLGLSGAR